MELLVRSWQTDPTWLIVYLLIDTFYNPKSQGCLYPTYPHCQEYEQQQGPNSTAKAWRQESALLTGKASQSYTEQCWRCHQQPATLPASDFISNANWGGINIYLYLFFSMTHWFIKVPYVSFDNPAHLCPHLMAQGLGGGKERSWAWQTRRVRMPPPSSGWGLVPRRTKATLWCKAKAQPSQQGPAAPSCVEMQRTRSTQEDFISTRSLALEVVWIQRQFISIYYLNLSEFKLQYGNKSSQKHRSFCNI